MVQPHSRRGYEGLVRAAEGRGPPVALLLVADALVLVRELRELVLGTGLVAEPCDTVPMGASETASDGSKEVGVYTPAEREPRRTTTTATEIPRTARMQMRITNQWRRQKEAVWAGLRCGGTRSEVDALGIDRGCDSENEWDGLGLDDGRASEVAAWWW